VGRADDAALDAWIFAAGEVVREVFAGGRRVVTAGRHIRADDVRRRYAATMRGLLAHA
jgi:formimidoylglutamate deiminase